VAATWIQGRTLRLRGANLTWVDECRQSVSPAYVFSGLPEAQFRGYVPIAGESKGCAILAGLANSDRSRWLDASL